MERQREVKACMLNFVLRHALPARASPEHQLWEVCSVQDRGSHHRLLMERNIAKSNSIRKLCLSSQGKLTPRYDLSCSTSTCGKSQ
jgi:hypothetical protein